MLHFLFFKASFRFDKLFLNRHFTALMCGIIGYVGGQSSTPLLLEGLRRLEYRGYDSAGISVIDNGKLSIRKRKGKIDDGLAPLCTDTPIQGNIGIGHTRWATHGEPSDANSHPHLDASEKISVVHNGVIENYDRLRDRLSTHGIQFNSETDTEVLAKLIGFHYAKETKQSGIQRLINAVETALKEVIGTYGIGVVCEDFPDTIVGARRGSPLLIGIGENENFLSSDASAVVAHTKRVVYLNDYDVVTLTAKDFHVTNLGSDTAKVQISQIEFDADATEKGEFAHYMLKEIYEQPQTVRNTMRGRVDLENATSIFGGLNLDASQLRSIRQIILIACGTSWHAALTAEYLIEEYAHIPVSVEYASEFRYRNAPIEAETLVIAITQSGETADTLAAMREAKRKGHPCVAICNVVGSTIARESDGGIYLHAGPEIGVASTKAFTSQVTALTLLAVMLGRIRMLSSRSGLEILQSLSAIPEQVASILKQHDTIRTIAKKYATVSNFFFIGRQYNFPVALEGALKLKEISYIHAEGYPAAEMKHGPIAMIDEKTPSVVIAPTDFLYEKTISNLKEIKARKGPIIAMTTEGNHRLIDEADEVIFIPKTLESLYPLLTVIPLQLLSYEIAVARGCEVDKPRNLAKSVTVE